MYWSYPVEMLLEAMRSVSADVDAYIVLLFGGGQLNQDAIREVVGDRLIVRHFQDEVNGQWSSTDSLRNAYIQAATELGFDWAMTLDADERVHLEDVDIRQELDRIDADIVLSDFRPGAGQGHVSYPKERFFRLPCRDRFIGDTHECMPPVHGRQKTMNGIWFTEVPKSPEQAEAKVKHIVADMTRKSQEEPNNPRHWYYLGDALAALDRDEEALKAFGTCADLRGWDEESAWACFRAGIILEKHGKYRKALDICAAGITRHPGIAEICWFAGHVCLRLGRFEHAIHWSEMAVANGTVFGRGKEINRVGWRVERGLTTGPFEVMREAYRALGSEQKEQECIRILKAIEEGRTYELGTVPRAQA
jgi:tetratricopeptide (TPR) repeat protein